MVVRPPRKKKKVRPKETPPETPSVGPDIDQERIDKLRDLQRNALKMGDPLRGALRSMAGDIFFISQKLNGQIVATIEDSGGLAQFERVGQSFELFLKLCRQADRLANLDQRISEKQLAKASPKPEQSGDFDS
ncbi:MAG: hypothetical protein CMJ50_08320 [Planctomycetaceae bacterium]|nr:hypothetical protein [Planctomycetaceae bacterium]